ncbi:tRNA lysidine(34) synthetase TilS [Laribacter hongkongensis]|uniref:tRNA lysidine(34) synthetase TilS n=1 Tax=Laribacter hongkongensis TaxID=168471 RepID=UPI0023D93FF5|nr:tRNA lysidine(34) synthetase TilS [Laribacter hongkongensis]MCG9059851.1 tRNA lysidine(34) synthetase TilS [Laribacter hongkongensis]MCG9086759.1 tRNA lysidine(34) synthetase TilS [Laribacter hongkongensis]
MPVPPERHLPALLDDLHAHWPEALSSGQCVLEVGLSGGVDSVVLLQALSRCATGHGIALRAVHVHHGLSPHADDWAGFCSDLCRELSVPLRIERVSVVRSGGQSLEAEARRARYAAYRNGGSQIVALAHHADDLAETVLLAALRGGGAHGLAAMPAWRVHDGLTVWRPLLGWRRNELESMARQQGWRWITDESNADPRYRRNALRHAVLPHLACYWPDYPRQLARTAQRAADEACVLDDCLDAVLEQHLRAPHILPVAVLASRPPAWQRLLLVRWLGRFGIAVSPGWLASVCPDWFEPSVRRESRLAGYVLLAGQGELRLLPDVPEPTMCHDWMLAEGEHAWPGWHGRLRVWREAGRGLVLPDGIIMQVRPGQAAETICHAVGRKALKKCWQEAGISDWQRRRWPRLWLGGILVAVPGVVQDHALSARPGQSGWCFAWEGPA